MPAGNRKRMGRDMAKFLAFVLVFSAAPMVKAALTIEDESLRTEILRAVFPNMAISVIPGRSINYSVPSDERPGFTSPDAFPTEKVYRIVGLPTSRVENCAAGSVLDQSESDTRELRFRAYSWPGAPDPKSDALVILQYNFPEAHPSGIMHIHCAPRTRCTTPWEMARIEWSGLGYDAPQ